MSAAAQCPRMCGCPQTCGKSGAVAAIAASLLKLAIASWEEVGASASRARFSKSRSRWRRLSCSVNGQEGCSEPRMTSNSRKNGQGNICLSTPTLASPAPRIVAFVHRPALTPGSPTLVIFRSGGLGLPCAVGAPMPPGPRRALHSNRAGVRRPVGSVVTVSDVGGPVPHSRRSRGALVVRRPATDTLLLGVPPKDLAAPVPAGAAHFSGQSYSRVCLRLQAVGRRAAVPRAFRSLPHLHVLSQWSEETTEGFEGVQKAFAGGANV